MPGTFFLGYLWDRSPAPFISQTPQNVRASSRDLGVPSEPPFKPHLREAQQCDLFRVTGLVGGRLVLEPPHAQPSVFSLDNAVERVPKAVSVSIVSLLSFVFLFHCKMLASEITAQKVEVSQYQRLLTLEYCFPTHIHYFLKVELFIHIVLYLEFYLLRSLL